MVSHFKLDILDSGHFDKQSFGAVLYKSLQYKSFPFSLVCLCEKLTKNDVVNLSTFWYKVFSL